MRAVSIDRKVVRFVIHDEETEPTAQGPATFELSILAEALTAVANCKVDPLGMATDVFGSWTVFKEGPNVGR